jgi:hypothetical protein
MKFVTGAVSTESCHANLMLVHTCAVLLSAYAKVVTYGSVTHYMFLV